jgi:hypothetical protein
MERYLRYTAAILVLALGACSDPQQQGTSSTESVLAETGPDTLMPAYDVVDRDIYDTPIKTQIKISAVVTGVLTEVNLRQVMQKLYDEANAMQGFKYHGGRPTHVFVYIYTSPEHFKSGMGQWIAMLSKIGEGAQPETQVKTELVAQLGMPPEIKHDLSETTRIEVLGLSFAQKIAPAKKQKKYFL